MLLGGKAGKGFVAILSAGEPDEMSSTLTHTRGTNFYVNITIQCVVETVIVKRFFRFGSSNESKNMKCDLVILELVAVYQNHTSWLKLLV